MSQLLDKSAFPKTQKKQTDLLSRQSAITYKKYLILTGFIVLTVVIALQSTALGSYNLNPYIVLRSILGMENGASNTIIWNIRLPRIVAAIVTGWALGLSGLSMQTLLRNSLSSPFTLGVSQGAAFGASFAIVILDAGQLNNAAFHSNASNSLFLSQIYSVTACACFGGLLACLVILFLASLKRMSASSVILAGVALSSLFFSGTILVQYFATETEIAAAVFWTFGDVARSNWQEIGVIAIATCLAFFYFLYHRLDLNALLAGDETAKGLGVDLNKLRLIGMLLASVIAALATAFHGVIAFLGLLAPHIARLMAGPDHKFLLPYSCIIGSLLLLLADTIGRLTVGSGALPVGVLTSFMGAPVFLCLLLRNNNHDRI